MATYRQIHTQIWGDPNVELLSPLAKLIFVYSFSNKHRNEACIYQITTRKISFETGIKLEQVEESLNELINREMVFYDWENSILWVKNAVKYQSTGEKTIKAIIKDVDGINSYLADKFREYYKGILNPFDTPSIPTFNNNNINNNINNNKNNYTPEFEQFWSYYPRRIEKKAAFKAWNARLNQKITPEEMITGAKNYALECKQKGRAIEFIKHPSTFIGPSEPFKDYLDGLPDEINEPAYEPTEKEVSEAAKYISICIETEQPTDIVQFLKDDRFDYRPEVKTLALQQLGLDRGS